MDEEATERTSLKESTAVETTVPMKRRFHIINNNGEHTLNLVLVIEDFRVGIYLTTLFIIVVGIILTKAFTKEDYGAIIESVYGGENTCIYFDFAPSTYVLPVLWCFAVIFGFLYSSTAIFRIRIAYLERKLSRCAFVMLILAYVYVCLSLILFEQAFAVQPNREKPETMVVHTLSYMNWKIMFGVLQVAVVYFGVKVSWVGLKLPSWFNTVSIVHAVALVISKIAAVFWILNALGDMGEKGLEGKGMWWSVRSQASIIAGKIIVNFAGLVLGLIFPLVQALFISWNGVNSHALVVAVGDNRVHECDGYDSTHAGH